MSLSEEQFAARIIAALDARELPADTLRRLELARGRALDAAENVARNRRDAPVLFKPSAIGVLGTVLLVAVAGVWLWKKGSRSEEG